MQLSAAIFDLDGLLVDTEIVSFEAYRALLAPYGHDFTHDTYATLYSGRPALQNMEAFIRRYQLPISVEEGLQFQYAYDRAARERGIDLKPGVSDLIDYLAHQGIRMALATSSDEERARALLEHHNILPAFDALVCGDMVVHPKPAPDIFLLAAHELDAGCASCVVFEDSEAGVRAGVAAGMHVICVPDLVEPSPEVTGLADATLGSLADAMAWLEDALA